MMPKQICLGILETIKLIVYPQHRQCYSKHYAFPRTKLSPAMSSYNLTVTECEQYVNVIAINKRIIGDSKVLIWYRSREHKGTFFSGHFWRNMHNLEVENVFGEQRQKGEERVGNICQNRENL